MKVRLIVAGMCALYSISMARANQPDIKAANAVKNGSALSTVFVENKGQWNPQARFLAQGKGVNLWITDTGPIYDFWRPSRAHGSEHQAVRVSLVGDAPSSAKGLEELKGRLNYFIGKDRSTWVRGVHRFKEVESAGVCEGVSLRYYAENEVPRYDLILKPGVDPRRIALRFNGDSGIDILPNGNLRISTACGDVLQKGLAAYQVIDGRRSEVACRMTRSARGFGFDLGAYDPKKRIVIDPLIFATYITSPSWNVQSVMSDNQGNIYGCEDSIAPGFPMLGDAGQPRDDNGAFVFKLDPTGSQLLYGTYIAGGNLDGITNQTIATLVQIAVDAKGDAYALGWFFGDDFPITSDAIWPDGSKYRFHLPDGAPGDSVLFKLDPTGSDLLYSTFLAVAGQSFAVDSSGDAYVYGYPLGAPATAGAFETEPPYALDLTSFSNYDGMVIKIDPDGKQLLYSTYLPMSIGPINPAIEGEVAPSLMDVGVMVIARSTRGIAVDDAGEAVVIGDALPGFPTTPGAWIPSEEYGGCVIAKLNAEGEGLVYATYLTANAAGAKGAPNNILTDVEESGTGDVVVVGGNEAPDSGPLLGLAHLNPEGKVVCNCPIPFATNFDHMVDASFDPQGNIVLFANGAGGLITTADALQKTSAGGGPFIMKLDPTGLRDLYSTFLGENQQAIVVDGCIRADGVAIIAGSSSEQEFATNGAYRSTPGYGVVVGVAMPPAAPQALTLSFGPPDSADGGKVLATLTCHGFLPASPVNALFGTNNREAVPPSSVTVPAGTLSVSFPVSVSPVSATTTVKINASLDGLSCIGDLTLGPPSFNDFYVAPTSVVGGHTSDGVVRFAQPVPSAGCVVTLTSTSVVSVPKQIVVPGGSTATSFHVSTSGVSASTSVTLKATFNSTSIETVLRVLPATLRSAAITPERVVGGTDADLTIELNGEAGPEGDLAKLSATGPVSLSPAVTIPPEDTSFKYPIATKPVASITEATVSVTLGTTTGNLTFEIVPPTISQLEIVPATVLCGQRSDAVLRLTGPAPVTGLVITLSKTGPLNVPASVKIPPGSSAVSFPISTQGVNTVTKGAITAKLDLSTKTGSLTVTPAVLTSFSLSANSVVGGKRTSGMVTLDGPAGLGGALVGIEAAGPITISHYVIVPFGSSTASFPIGTSPVTGATKVVISVLYGSANLVQTLTLTP